MIIWTPTAFECLICMRFLFLYLHLFNAVEHVHMDKRSRNTLIIIITIIIIIITGNCLCSFCDLHFPEARRQGFSPGTPVSTPSSSVNGSANKIKLK